LSRLQNGEPAAKFGDCFAYTPADAQQGKSNEGETKWPRKPWRSRRSSKQRNRWWLYLERHLAKARFSLSGARRKARRGLREVSRMASGPLPRWRRPFSRL